MMRPFSPRRRFIALSGSFAAIGLIASSAGPHVTAQSREQILYAFAGPPDGYAPSGPIMVDAAGALYGTTTFGGTGCGRSGCGTVYQLSPTASGYSERILHSFTGAPADGTQPGGVVAGRSGALYGTTTYGGNGPCDGFWPGCGTVFKLAPSGSGYTESVIHSFWGGTDGAFPEGGLVVDAAGDLYGTTDAGGRTGIRVGEGSGTVFRIAPTLHGYAESILYRFQGGRDGANPSGTLTEDGSGALYGPTDFGGSKKWGVIFKLTPSVSGYSKSTLYDFSAVYSYPQSVLLGAGGSLFGATDEGGRGHYCGGSYYHGCGTVFELIASGSRYVKTVLHRFRGLEGDGAFPTGALVANGADALYGVTFGGGRGTYCDPSGPGCGTVYTLAPTSRGYRERVLWSFARISGDGSNPTAGLVWGPNGALFGATSSGGTCSDPLGCGTVFELRP